MDFGHFRVEECSVAGIGMLYNVRGEDREPDPLHVQVRGSTRSSVEGMRGAELETKKAAE